MGLDSNISDMSNVQDGLDPSGNTSNIPSLKYNIQKGLVTPYMKHLLKTNMVRDVQRDKNGMITGLTATHNPFDPTQIGVSGLMGLIGQAVPGLSTVSNVVSGLFGPATTYTGYNPDTTDIGGDENDSLMDQYRPQIRPINPPVAPASAPVRRLTSAELFNQNPDRYTLNVSGINSLRNR